MLLTELSGSYGAFEILLLVQVCAARCGAVRHVYSVGVPHFPHRFLKLNMHASIHVRCVCVCVCACVTGTVMCSKMWCCKARPQCGSTSLSTPFPEIKHARINPCVLMCVCLCVCVLLAQVCATRSGAARHVHGVGVPHISCLLTLTSQHHSRGN